MYHTIDACCSGEVDINCKDQDDLLVVFPSTSAAVVASLPLSAAVSASVVDIIELLSVPFPASS